MHEELWQKFESLDPQRAMQRAGCKTINGDDQYIITMLNQPYRIDLEKRKIFSSPVESEKTEAGFLDQLCILAYLIHSKELLPTNQLIKPESLPGGQFFFRGHHSLPTDTLKDVFGGNPEKLYQASLPLGAKPCDFGDASIEIPIFNRVPVTFVVWGGDEEFSARASILFDSTASEQLPLDALHVAVHLAVKALTKSDIINQE